ncbi:MAG TPA: TldD/PmbA family protein [candidate division Zixibacteria bacterium]|nr:TldD/PmbA family protein [candidate division Zixibacteria bacterium]
MVFNKELLLEKGQFVLKEAEKLGASQAQVTIISSDRSLTRLANSIIDQNVAERHFNVSTDIYIGKRKGSTNVEVFDDKSIANAVANAVQIAKISPENQDFKSLPGTQNYTDILTLDDLVSKKTIDATPEQRAEYAKLAIDCAHSIDKRIKAVAGAISHSTNERVILNSLGVEAYDRSTTSNINLTVLADDGTEETAGWSSDNRMDFSKLQVKAVSEKAAQKAVDGFGMKYLEPGNYEVILEPAAAGGLMFYLSYFGFSAMMYQDYISFLRDKIGDQIFSEKLNLWDDAYDKRMEYRDLFDSEGIPKSKLELITEGICKNLVYDTLTADKDGVKSTGHSAAFFGRSLPIATHLFVGEGDSSLDEMIAETRNGILVTHFHYQNAVNPTKGVFTGLTRDGAWFIKDGEIQYPLRTLRYTDSILRFFKEIDLIGKYQDPNDTNGNIPPLKLPSFTISGSQKE